MKKLSLQGWFVLAAGIAAAATLATADDYGKPNAPTKQAEQTAAQAEKPAAEAPALPAPIVGKPAPDFTLKDASGKDVALASFKDKYVVLEWVNFGCPFVRKHYSSGNMQRLQEEYTKKGVVWLSICSSAAGKEGYFAGEALTKKITDENSHATAYLVDTDGKVGKEYGAKTTPHMFIIDPKGAVIYGGAIDDKRSANVADIEAATNYVRAALDASMAGKPVQVASTQSYGCSVKYAS